MSSGTTNEDMVQAFTPNRPNQLLSKRVLPGTPCRSNDLVHSQRLDAPAKLVTADRVPITDQVARQRRVAGCVVHREVHRHFSGLEPAAALVMVVAEARGVALMFGKRSRPVVGVRKPRCFQSTGFVAVSMVTTPPLIEQAPAVVVVMVVVMVGVTLRVLRRYNSVNRKGLRLGIPRARHRRGHPRRMAFRIFHDRSRSNAQGEIFMQRLFVFTSWADRRF